MHLAVTVHMMMAQMLSAVMVLFLQKMFMHKVDAAVYPKQVLLREKQSQMG